MHRYMYVLMRCAVENIQFVLSSYFRELSTAVYVCISLTGYWYECNICTCTRLKVEQRVWSTHGLNFDNIGNAALTLFAMLTSEGWQE